MRLYCRLITARRFNASSRSIVQPEMWHDPDWSTPAIQELAFQI